MKRIILSFVLAFISLIVVADNFKAPVSQRVQFTDTTTNHTYEIKDKTYPIYKSKSGKFYIWKTSKNGKLYKYYLPKEIQEQINK